MLAPASASARLLSAVQSLDMTGVTTISVPLLPTRPTALFVGEGKPGPVVQLAFGSVVLGPVKKILIITSMTNEMESASAGTAEMILSNAIAASAEVAMDTALFSNAAGTAIALAGILNGVTPIASTATGGGARAVADDIGALAKAISGNGFGVDGMLIVTTAELAMAARVLVGPRFQNLILSSPAIPTGQVIGLLPNAMVAG